MNPTKPRVLSSRQISSRSTCVNPTHARHTYRRELISGLTLVLLSVHNYSVGAGIFGISEEEYRSDTTALAGLAKEVSTMAKDANGKKEKVGSLRMSINNWVAKYRRLPEFAGRPSYSNMYSAVNALSGHFNNFGPTAQIPSKRLNRVLQELEQSSLLLSKKR